MAFFSKPSAKKPPDPKPDAPLRPGAAVGTGRVASARELASQVAKGGRLPVDPGDITVSGASLVQWTPAQSAFEVAQANPGLCAVLETPRCALRAVRRRRRANSSKKERERHGHQAVAACLARPVRSAARAIKRCPTLCSSTSSHSAFRSSVGDKRRIATPVLAAGGGRAVAGRLSAGGQQPEGLQSAIARKADATLTRSDVGQSSTTSRAAARCPRRRARVAVKRNRASPTNAREALKGAMRAKVRGSRARACSGRTSRAIRGSRGRLP
jgi:hypothetical protein